MSEKLLYENLLGGIEFNEILKTKISESTDSTDIAQTAPKLGFAHSVASKTLPATLGYVQPINSPSGYVFTMKKGPAVNQTLDMPYFDDGTGTPAVGSAGAEDLQITRTPIVTGMRQVLLDFTNELAQDVQNLFSEEFADVFADYLYYNGLSFDPENFETSSKENLQQIFIEFATWAMMKKTNSDFCTWLGTAAKNLGTATIADFSEIGNLKSVVAELKNYLYSNTTKTGRTWVLGSPKIINYLLMDQTNATADNETGKKGKRIPNSLDYNYVFTLGETDFYQDVNITDKIYAGISGKPGESSIFYTPFKEYFVQGAASFETGQNNVWFKMRDSWVLNPLDNNIVGQSKFICSANVVFTLPSLIV